MGADPRKSKRSSGRRSGGTATPIMARTRAKPDVSGSFLRARISGLSTSLFFILFFLAFCVGVIVVVGYGRRYGAVLRTEVVRGVGEERQLRVFRYEVVEEFPHDPLAFTQGLFYDGNDTFYESTGLYGKSSVRKVNIKTGEVLQQQMMDGTQFGEGLTLWGSRLLQVSWLTKKGFIYDKLTLEPVGSFHHPMQDGWGLTSGEEHIIGSDGTANIYFMDPSSFKEVRKVTVKDDGRPVRWLNELEYIQGEIWANVYQTECIAQISPKDGRVTGWLLMHGLKNALLAKGVKQMDVLNGIAWDSERKRLYVTGKQWPKVYEIKVIDETSQFPDLIGVRRACIH